MPLIRFRSGLTLRISIAFACFAGVLLVGVGVTSYSSGRTALESAAVSELLSSAISKKSNINEWHRNAVADVEAIAASPALVAATTEMLSTNLPADITRQAHDRLVAELMPRTRLQSRRHLLIAIADPISGQIIAATQLSMEGQSVAQQLYFSIANKKSYVQNPTISTYLNRPVITIGTPIRAPNGMVRGVLLAWIDLSELNNIVQQRTGLHQSDDAYLVNPDHQYVTQPRFMKQAAVLTTKVYTEGVDRALTGYSGILLASDYNEVPSIIVYRWLPNQRLGLITLITQEEALTLAKEFRIAILLTSVLVLLVASGISIALARTIVHPIRILQEGVSRFGQGEFALRLPVTFDNELGQLAREFNNMADAINQKGRELQQNASQLELRVQERTRTLKRQADLLELAHDAIIVRRADGTIDYWNHGAREMYGWAHNEARGRIIHDLLKTHFPIDLDEFNHELLKVGRWEGELVHTRRDGRTIVVVSRQAVRYDDKGTAIAILEINTDISERKIAETQLTLAKDAAEAATNAKSDFLANMSHEIRTPMNGVIGLTNLVLKTPLTDRQRDYLGLIKGSADSLLRLLNDILDFSKMEARKLELELIEFDLREELGNTLKAFSATANEKNIELIHHVMPGVPSWIVGDAGRLSQIIVNLTGNALKFTKEGEVVVRVLQEASDDQSVVLRFSVSDSGIGIPKEQQEIIFSAFAQADSSTTREYGGTGLGLAIVAQLVNLMHGKVWIDSAPGKGTTFHFTARFHLPAQQKLEAATYIAQRASLNNLAILVVDDNRTNRMILAEILSNWTMHPVLAGDADQALQLLQQQIEMQKSFPVVLLDMHMKDVNCYELAEAIKARSVGQVEFIMMMSANDMDDDIDRYRQIGIRNFLHKPIKQSNNPNYSMRSPTSPALRQVKTCDVHPPKRKYCSAQRACYMS